MISKPRGSRFGLVVAIVCGLTSNVWAANATSHDFPNQVVVSGVPMELQGTGIKSVAFIKAFAAALYSVKGSDVRDGGKKIVVQYYVKISGEKLSRFTIKSMRKNVSEQQMAALSDEIDRMSELFVDLEPGDQFALAYVPGEGTQFIHNGQLTGTIYGAAFAQALYSVWIGDKPFDPKLKRSIMGGEENKRRLPFFAHSN